MPREYPVRREDITRAPIHPGVILAEDVLPALRMTVSQAARHLRVTRQTLHRIIAGRTAITPEMALRLGKFCGNGPELWLRMQEQHDLWQAKRKLKGEIEKIPTVDAA
jgi:antitoxin HigA-1